MRPLLWPRNIRGKLVMALLATVVPVLAIGTWDEVEALWHGMRGRCDAFATLALVLAAMGLGAMVAFVTGNRLAHTIRRLALAANAISVGDYRKRVKIAGADELRTLAEALNTLARNIARHENAIRRQAEMLAAMSDAARIASSSLNLEECGKMVAKVTCTHFGAKDASVFRKTGEDQEVKPIGRCGRRARSAWRLIARRVAESGEMLMMTERPQVTGGPCDEALLVGVPLVSGDEAIGAIIARYEGVKRRDLEPGSVRGDILCTFGIHAAAAISNADAYSRSEEYSEVLEEWVDHLSAVMQVTDAISPSLTLDETLEALAKAAAAALKADLCCIYRPDRDGYLVVKATSNPEDGIAGKVRLRPGDSETGVAFAEKRTVVCRNLARSRFSVSRRFGEATAMRSLLSTPLVVEDRAIGAISIASARPRQFMPSDIRLLTSISLHTAVIVRNADLYTKELSIAEALQENLLPEVPERCRGLELASRYVPALDEARVGGDFYEVVPLPDGRMGIVIGDVSGKGLNAAIHLAACKYMLRPLMYAHPDDPAAVLAKLDEALSYYFHGDFFVTVFYGVLDPEDGSICYANAGHPPGLLIGHKGRMHSWLQATGTPVGSGVASGYHSLTVRAERGDMLLLCTDGVTDSLLGDDPLGIEGLEKVVYEAGNCSASDLVSQICDRLVGNQSACQKDDIALLAVSFETALSRRFEPGIDARAGDRWVPAQSV